MRKVGVRKGQILDAALLLFAERGYTDTGMEEIAAAVGMVPSSLYNHWRSKQDLLQTIMENTAQDLIDNSASVTKDAPSAVEELSALMEAYVRYHVKHSRAARVTIRERSSLSADAEKKVEGLHRAHAALWYQVIDRGVVDGQFDVGSILLTTNALLEMGIGVSQWIDRFAPMMSIEEVANEYVQMALKLVGYRP